jgi:catechol 2,3-dioxygenase
MGQPTIALGLENAGTERDISTPRLHHINLKTTRLQEMIDWYGLVVGMTVVHRWDESGAWLSNDEANHRLALLSTPQTRDDPDKLFHAGVHHSAYEYSEFEDLLKNYVRLEAAGVRPHAVLDHGMTLSFYYADPDGNSVELQADVFGDWALSKEFMRGEPFAQDPIGTYVDPQQLIEAWQTGLARDELHARAHAGAYTPADAQDLRVR